MRVTAIAAPAPELPDQNKAGWHCPPVETLAVPLRVIRALLLRYVSWLGREKCRRRAETPSFAQRMKPARPPSAEAKQPLRCSGKDDYYASEMPAPGGAEVHP
jgi:hypothetical protein